MVVLHYYVLCDGALHLERELSRHLKVRYAPQIRRFAFEVANAEHHTLSGWLDPDDDLDITPEGFSLLCSAKSAFMSRHKVTLNGSAPIELYSPVCSDLTMVGMAQANLYPVPILLSVSTSWGSCKCAEDHCVRLATCRIGQRPSEGVIYTYHTNTFATSGGKYEIGEAERIALSHAFRLNRHIAILYGQDVTRK